MNLAFEGQEKHDHDLYEDDRSNWPWEIHYQSEDPIWPTYTY